MSEEQRNTALEDVYVFLQQVDEMRQRQKRYYEYSGKMKQTLLSRAKQQERIVDKRLGRAKSLVFNLKQEEEHNGH